MKICTYVDSVNVIHLFRSVHIKNFMHFEFPAHGQAIVPLNVSPWWRPSWNWPWSPCLCPCLTHQSIDLAGKWGSSSICQGCISFFIIYRKLLFLFPIWKSLAMSSLALSLWTRWYIIKRMWKLVKKTLMNLFHLLYKNCLNSKNEDVLVRFKIESWKTFPPTTRLTSEPVTSRLGEAALERF